MGSSKSMLEEFKEFLDSEEGQKSLDRFVEKHLREDACTDRWIEKIKSRYGDNPDPVIEKLMEKYYSDSYVNREYKMGVQPREPLFWLIWEYAEKHCESCVDKKYYNSFTGDAYYIGSYVIQIMYGQGSVLRFDKLK